MSLDGAGRAYIDRTGALVGADAVFLSRLGLEGPDPAAALRARAAGAPQLHALVAGDGPRVAEVPGERGAVEVERVPAGEGAFLVARDAGSVERVEHALRSLVLGRVVVGVAHEIKNPLNAIILQLALLEAKLEDDGGGAPRTVASHLAAVRGQVARVDEVLRRLAEATDPGAPMGFTDLGALLADVASLFAYELRRRGIEASLAVPSGHARTRCDPARVGRLVLALFGRALAATPDGGRFTARTEARGAEVLVEVVHAAGDPARDLGYESEVLAGGAAMLGGRFERSRPEPGLERLTLTMPGNERE